MSLFQIFTILLVLTAAFSYINQSTLRLPTSIGIMLFALVTSLLFLILQYAGVGWAAEIANQALDRLAFNDTLLHGVLGYLLFAGALFVNLDELLQRKGIITLLALVGTLLSAVMVAGLAYGATALLGLKLPLLYCLLFGILISPTDPISVLGILRRLGVPRAFEVKITGESLFNDGISVVLFLALLGIVKGEEIDAGAMSGLFLLEVGGGVLLGVGLGTGCYWLLKRIDEYSVEILLSLALVTGGYALADALHMSAPIFAVTAGLLIGNVGRQWAMSNLTREHLDKFWELVDELLNALLFALLGLEMLTMNWNGSHVAFGLLMVPVVLVARFLSVSAIVQPLRLTREFPPWMIRLLTWGALRGGISVALALSLPAGPSRDVIVAATYIVVVFSILVQGLTLERLVRSAGFLTTADGK